MSDFDRMMIAAIHERVQDGLEMTLFGRRYVPAPERDSLVVRFRRWLAEKVAP